MGYHAVWRGMFCAMLADPPHLRAYSWNIFLGSFKGGLGVAWRPRSHQLFKLPVR
jgi:hypothetical protein